ncbi:MAG: DUF6600 domain-containing protein [Terriglobales bacterium]
MKIHKISVIGLVLAGLMLLLQSPSALLAQDQENDQVQGQVQGNQQPQDNGQEGQDPPSRVARLNHADGSVSFQPGGEGDWVQAVENRPLTTGDNLWADKDSRAELHVGSTALRLGPESSLTFLELDDQTTQLKLSQGSLILRVRHLDDGDLFEVDTPNLAFTVQRVGEYRIDVNGDGNETNTIVWHGRGEVTGGGSSYIVVAGQDARFTGADELDHEINQIPASDDLDNWAFARDEREDHSESANYISTEMTGYEDLDDYGTWHYAAGYGPVWTPRGIAVGWAPYRVGHWVWIAPWGWTWVEDEPWGFAPFHYGRWAYVSDSWCWVPGPVVVRPVYAPALVAFVGGGGFRVGIGIGGGVGVGWFPLAPHEVYVPWYRTSPRYVNNVNITNTRVNVTQVTNVYNNYHNNTSNVTRITYVNQHINNGVTVVSHDTFVNARPVARNVVRVDQRQIEQAQVVRGQPVQPVRASVIGAGAAARIRPPAAVEARRVVGTRMPTPPSQSFEQRQSVNVRTERPGAPQPVGQSPTPGGRSNGMQPTQPRGQEPARINESPRPETQQIRPQEPAARANEIPRPQAGGRQQTPAMNERNVPRPPAQNQRRTGEFQPNENTRATQRSLVRQAPPVQQRPEQQRSEEQKFGNWQRQRQQAAPPREAPRTQERAQPQQRVQPQPKQESKQEQKREPHK